MEPFGLFQFLQNLLASQGNFSPDSPTNAQEPTPPAEEKNTPPAPPTPPQKNAATQFLENHERRAGRKK